MRRRTVGITAGVIGLAVAASVIPAVESAIGRAATTPAWTAGALKLTDTTHNVSLECSGSTASLTPTNSVTSPAGEITSISFSNCSALGEVFTLTPAGLDWPIIASPAGRTIGETSGGHGISINITSPDDPGCTANVDGTGYQTDTGVATFIFSHASGKLEVVVTGDNLHIYQPSSACPTIKNGDAVSFTVAYTIG